GHADPPGPGRRPCSPLRPRDLSRSVSPSHPVDSMNWIESLILGVLQGLTEFLPISSSGHLVVAEGCFADLGSRPGSGSEHLFFNVMLHLGTLGAILAFYGEPIGKIVRGLATEPAPSTGGVAAWTMSGLDRRSILRACLLTGVATMPAVVVALG